MDEKPENEQGQQEETQKEETVPMERFEEANTEANNLREQNATLTQQMALIRANAPQPKPQFDIYKEAGVDPDNEEDIPTTKQVKMINDYNQQQTDAKLAQIRFLLDHPDFAQVVGTTDQIATAQFAEPLREAIKANPALIALIQNSENQNLAAYQVAKLHQEKGTEKVTKKEAQTAIDEAVENAKRTKSSSTVKGGGALPEEGRYADMPDDEFVELARSMGATI